MADGTTFLLGNARAESSAADEEERRVIGDRGRYFWFSRLFPFRFVSFRFSFTFVFVLLILLQFFLFYFLSACALWVLSRFGGISVVRSVVPSFILSFVSVAVPHLAAGPNASTQYLSFDFPLEFSLFVVFVRDFLDLAWCWWALVRFSLSIRCCDGIIRSCVHPRASRLLGRLDPL